ncbi:unnamed protein product, partial [Caretta caretta]
DQRRTRISDRFGQSAAHIGNVMAIARHDMPAGRFSIGRDIFAARQVDSAVDGDLVIVPQHDRAAKVQVIGQANRFMVDAFHRHPYRQSPRAELYRKLFPQVRHV